MDAPHPRQAETKAYSDPKNDRNSAGFPCRDEDRSSINEHNPHIGRSQARITCKTRQRSIRVNGLRGRFPGFSGGNGAGCLGFESSRL